MSIGSQFDDNDRYGIFAITNDGLRKPISLWADSLSHALIVSATTDKSSLNTLIFTSGAITYVAQALPGTAASTSLWRVKKINSTTSPNVINWANGNANFINAATDLATVAAYTYS